MRPHWLLALFPLALFAQTDAHVVAPHLAPLNTPDVVASEIRHYLIAKAPAPPAAESAAEWTAEARRLRARFLDEIVFHGWPADWRTSAPRFEDLGAIESKGYRARKLRYEIAPGFWSTAVLYEPAHLSGKVPAILNVNGHVGAPGKSVEYKQKRCIEQARMGALALNLEWINHGELATRFNDHWNLSQLDLVGANGLGLMYLAMRRGLDFLYDHPNADRSRIGVTGLSGGGWQTIVLSALDERVTLAVPVAGYSSFASRVERTADTGDYEQNATDMLRVADYPALTAMRAPRPTLLVFNAEDDCCFRGPLVKPDIFDAVRPVFARYAAAAKFDWHENRDPSDHNYQLDNRMAAYRFIAANFGLKAPELEAPAELLSFEEMAAGLPEGNLTIVDLARRLAANRQEGGDLRAILRHQPVAIRRAWPLHNTKSKGLETESFRIDFANGLSATAVWLHAIAAPPYARATIVLNDKGKQAAGEEVADRVNRGDNVFAVDLFLHGDAAPAKPGPHHYAQMFTALGERPLALQAAQLAAIAAWVKARTNAPEVRVETKGPRTQMAALAAAAMSPGLFSDVLMSEAIGSLRRLLDAPVEYTAAPELFVLDLYRHFDVESMRAMAAPTRIAIHQAK
ncbi:MAG: acetylxylan esterase [Acidobacteria bacterium]|nr:acetylxylan esterase [Acidobacteriota bacterium]